MTNQENLDLLKHGREMLSKCYVKWTKNDGKGGHCHSGVIEIICITEQQCSIWNDLNEAARRLYSMYTGISRPRYNSFYEDNFDLYPSIFVNNQLGKEAILAVWDDEIARIETAILYEQESEKLIQLQTSLSTDRVMNRTN